jgi:5-methylcytosine-specific restriction enzyme A
VSGWQHGDQRQRGGRPWRRLRLQILKRDQYLCRCGECVKLGRVRIATEVDHVIPVAKGGGDDPSNLRAIAHECHVVKTQTDEGHKPKPRIGADGWPIG